MKDGIKLLLVFAAFALAGSNKILAQQNSDSLLQTAKHYMLDQNYTRAASVLDSAAASDSLNANLLYNLGICYQAMSKFNTAADVLAKAADLSPENLNILNSLGSNYLSAGRLNEADSVLTRAFLIDSSNVLTLSGLGRVKMLLEQWGNAAYVYSMLINRDSTNSYFYEQRAQCYYSLDDADKAIVDYQIAMRLNPFNQHTVLRLSYLYYLKNQYLSALRVVNAGLAQFPNQTSFWKRRGEVFFQLKDYKKSIDGYSHAVSLGDSSADNYRNLGVCYYFLDKYDSSKFFLEKSIKLNSKDPVAYFYMGASFKMTGLPDSALAYLQQAADLLRSGFLAETFTQIAAAYQDKKDYRLAIKYYNDAVEENPDKKVLTFYLAVMYDKYYKDKSIALNYYRKYLADTDSSDKKILSYAENRVRKLVEENHFNKSRK